MRKHAGGKPSVCDKCGMSFTEMSNFQRHVNLHEIEALYCSKCGKPFSTLAELESHELSHSDYMDSVAPNQ